MAGKSYMALRTKVRSVKCTGFDFYGIVVVTTSETDANRVSREAKAKGFETTTQVIWEGEEYRVDVTVEKDSIATKAQFEK